MTPKQLEEFRRLVRLLNVRTCRRFAVKAGLSRNPNETSSNTEQGYQRALDNLESYVCQLAAGEVPGEAPEEQVLSSLLRLASDQRTGIFYHFCTACGDANPTCRCWDDS
jgi:hypothetical protein